MARDRKRAKQRRARQTSTTRPKAPSRQARALDPERRTTAEPPDPVDEASGDAELAKEAVAGAPTDEVAIRRASEDDPDANARVYPDELSDEDGDDVLSSAGAPDVDDADLDLDLDADAGAEEGRGDRPRRGAAESSQAEAAAPSRRDSGAGASAEAASAALGRPARREPARPSEGNRILAFLRACWAELQRVQWPDRRQVGQATAVVLGFVVIAGSYLGLMDYIWQKVVTALLDL